MANWLLAGAAGYILGSSGQGTTVNNYVDISDRSLSSRDLVLGAVKIRDLEMAKAFVELQKAISGANIRVEGDVYRTSADVHEDNPEDAAYFKGYLDGMEAISKMVCENLQLAIDSLRQAHK